MPGTVWRSANLTWGGRHVERAARYEQIPLAMAVPRCIGAMIKSDLRLAENSAKARRRPRSCGLPTK